MVVAWKEPVLWVLLPRFVAAWQVRRYWLVLLALVAACLVAWLEELVPAWVVPRRAVAASEVLVKSPGEEWRALFGQA